MLSLSKYIKIEQLQPSQFDRLFTFRQAQHFDRLNVTMLFTFCQALHFDKLNISTSSTFRQAHISTSSHFDKLNISTSSTFRQAQCDMVVQLLRGIIIMQEIRLLRLIFLGFGM
jgi:hypothetical protein